MTLGQPQANGGVNRHNLQTFGYVVELEQSFQEWCNTWGPFRSRRVSDRAEDSCPRAVRERFSLTGTTPRRRPGTGYLLNYLINY